MTIGDQLTNNFRLAHGELDQTGNAVNPKISIKPAKTIEIAGSRLQQEIARGLAESARRDTTRRDSSRTDSTKVEDPLQKGRDALKRLLGK